MAIQRLSGLLKKFTKEPEYETAYRTAVQKYFHDWYALPITAKHELDHPRQLFLPHHGVYKKSAEKKKLRIVFDATAEYKGKSLNNSMITGPKLQKELAEIFLKFRERPIAIGADIEAMFSRIRLTKDDARYHRFLMPDKQTGKIEVYQMNRLTFGDGASPFVAMSTLHRTADDYGGKQDRAKKAIKENFYMDDYLDSFDVPEEAIRVGGCVREILRKGDFNLTKWISNSGEVRKAFGVEKNDGITDVSGKEEGIKVLGVAWTQEADVFTFRINNTQNVIYTRRGLLSKIAGMFDPLGLAAPATIKGKIGLQRMTIAHAGWDEPLDEEERTWWDKWLKKLEELRSLRIPRCIRPVPGTDIETEMHIFCDASEEAFAAVAYLRTVRDGKYIASNIIMAKTR